MTSFVNGFAEVVVGNTATTTVQFILPAGTDASAGSITYALLDSNGTIYSSGGSNTYTTTTTVNSVIAQAIVNVAVPSNVPTNYINSQYQVRLTLTIPGQPDQYMYTQITILPLEQIDQGATDVVELKGNILTIQLVLPVLVPYVTANLYYENTQINNAPPTVFGPTQTSDGYVWTINLDTSTALTPAGLVPYNFIWIYGQGAGLPNDSQASAIYIVTPSMQQALKDMILTVNKARTSIGDKPTYSTSEALSYLRNGMDAFNAFGIPTIFDMTNATGPVRFYWLKWSSVEALRAQYMFEGESAFDFQGQAISLSVERTQYYEGLASSIENQIQSPCTQLKNNLGKRGLLSGDGNVNPTVLNVGAIGSIGISLSPVSNVRPFNSNYWLGGLRNIF